MTLWLGLDPADGTDDERELEHRLLHLLEDLGGLLPAEVVATHWVGQGALRHGAASLRLPHEAPSLDLVEALEASWSGALVLDADDQAVEQGDRPGRAAAREALEQARTATAGRLVRFPGQESLVAPLPVDDVPLVCAVQDVVPVVGALAPGTLLDPCRYVRPRWQAGRVVLPVRPGPGGTVVPVERASVHACAGH